MKYNKIELLAGLWIVIVFAALFFSVRHTVNYLESDEFKKDATELRDWIKG